MSLVLVLLVTVASTKQAFPIRMMESRVLSAPLPHFQLVELQFALDAVLEPSTICLVNPLAFFVLLELLLG